MSETPRQRFRPTEERPATRVFEEEVGTLNRDISEKEAMQRLREGERLLRDDFFSKLRKFKHKRKGVKELSAAIALFLAGCTTPMPVQEERRGGVEESRAAMTATIEELERQMMDDEERERIRLWLEQLKIAQKLGYTIRVDPHICVDLESRTSKPVSFIKDEILTSCALLVRNSSDPFAHLQSRYPDLSSKPSEFSPTKEIAIPLFVLEVKQFGEDNVVVRLKNWLTPEDFVNDVDMIALTGRRDAYQQMRDAYKHWETTRPKFLETMRAVLSPEALAANQKKLDTQLELLDAPEPPAPLFSFAEAMLRSPEEEEALQAFFHQWSIEMEVIPAGGHIDRFVNIGGIAFSLPHVLPWSVKKQLLRTPLITHGHVQKIYLRQEITGAPIPKAESRVATAEGEPTVEHWKDDHGTSYFKCINFGWEKDEKTRQPFERTIMVIPPPALSKEDHLLAIPLRLDLGRFGGEVPVWMMRSSEKFYGTEGPYRLYTNMSADEARLAFPEEKIRAFAEGLRAVEELFGHPAGSIVRNIYCPNSEKQNAESRGETVILCDEWVRNAKNLQSLMSVGAHEAAHSIDQGYSAHAAWEQCFVLLSEIRAEFLPQICEQEFSGDKSQGGHAYDNSKEFFASFLNSVRHEAWAERFRAMSDRNSSFPHFYRETLDALRLALDDFRRIGEIPEDAPIFARIDEVKSMIEEFQKERAMKK